MFATPLSDPGVPDGETSVYRITQDKKTWDFTERVSVIDEVRASYRFEYEAPGERTTIFVRRTGMRPYATRNVSNGGSVTIESTTHVDMPDEMESDAIMLVSFTELKYLLRGYPFKDGPDLDVIFFSTNDEDDSEGPDFSIRVRYHGLEELTIGSRKIETHKLELKYSAGGVLRLLGGLIPKTYYWYSAEPAHYLVAYEGSSGFPGSSKRRIEIIDYSGW